MATNNKQQDIPKGWKWVKLGEVVDIIGGGTPKTSVAKYWNGDIPWLSVGDFNTGRKFVFDSEKRVTIEGLKNSSTKLLNRGDIIISARGTVGVIAMLGRKMAFNQSCYGIKAKPNTTNNFVYYLLKAVVNVLQRNSYGAVFDTITRQTFNEVPILLPPLQEQKAIGEVLSSLDDKIELLHKQNKTLEDMAQALFRKWFVDNPEREGWKRVRLGEVVEISSGKGLKRSNYVLNGKYPVLGANGEIGRTDKYLLNDKVIFTGRVGTLGNVFISEGKVWLSDNTLIIKPQLDYFYFVYFLLKNKNLGKMNVGSTQPLIRQSDLKSITVYLPSKNLLQKIEGMTTNFFIKMRKNKSQIHTLENLRDTLLPKLMSGKVRVKM